MQCPMCEGDGEIYVGSSVPDDEGYDQCGCCGGSGEMPTPEQISDLRIKLQACKGDRYVDNQLLQQEKHHAESVKNQIRLLWLKWVNKKVGFPIVFQELMSMVGIDYKKL